MSIERASLSVPLEQRARFVDRARLVVERARANGVSREELELSLRVLSVLHGAATPDVRGEP